MEENRKDQWGQNDSPGQEQEFDSQEDLSKLNRDADDTFINLDENADEPVTTKKDDHDYDKNEVNIPEKESSTTRPYAGNSSDQNSDDILDLNREPAESFLDLDEKEDETSIYPEDEDEEETEVDDDEEIVEEDEIEEEDKVNNPEKERNTTPPYAGNSTEQNQGYDPKCDTNKEENCDDKKEGCC